jgi:hypothetical protein
MSTKAVPISPVAMRVLADGGVPVVVDRNTSYSICPPQNEAAGRHARF